MQIVILSAIIASLVALDGMSREANPWAVLAALVGYLAVAAVLAGASASLALAQMRHHPEPGRWRRRLCRLVAIAVHLWLIAGSPVLIIFGYGRLVTHDLALGTIPLAWELLALGPLILAVLINWTIEYPVHRAMRQSLSLSPVWRGRIPAAVWTRGQYLANNVRHHLLFILAPISLILTIRDALVLYVPAAVAPYVTPPAMLVAAGGVFLLIPLVIVRIWRTERLPDGPVRSDLEHLCRRLDLEFRELLIWRSGGVIANAGVVGILPRARYILLSDALLENFSPAQIRAIFAHEAAHIMHHHIFYAVIFVVSSVTLCTTATQWVGYWLGWDVSLSDAAGAALAVGCLVVGFGWLSRRFERQSDATAAMLVGPGDDDPDSDIVTPTGASIFADALERIAWINGIDPHRRNWRHGPIGWRVRYLIDLSSRGGTVHEIGRVVKWAKRVVWAMLAVAVATVAWSVTVFG